MPRSDAEFFDLIQRKDVAGALGALAARPDLARARDSYLGTTPLHVAAHRGLTSIVAALVDAGADTSARDSAYQATAAGWAEFAGHAGIADLLAGPSRRDNA